MRRVIDQIDGNRLRRLYLVEGYSIEHIATLLGLSSGTVHARLVALHIDRRSVGPRKNRQVLHEPPRRIPLELWQLPLPYFDGRCEVHTRGGYAADGRCLNAANVARDGQAICRFHATWASALHGYVAEALRFRGKRVEDPTTSAQRPRSPEEWDF